MWDQYLAGAAGNSCVTECSGMFSAPGTLSECRGFPVDYGERSDRWLSGSTDYFYLSGSALLFLGAALSFSL